MKITGKLKKVWINEKNHVVELTDGTRLSKFGTAPDDLTEGESYEFDYYEKGQYKNYTAFKPVTQSLDAPLNKVSETVKRNVRELGTNPDAAFGMIFNLAVVKTEENIKLLDKPTDEQQVFNVCFDRYWKWMLDKRKEKLS